MRLFDKGLASLFIIILWAFLAIPTTAQTLTGDELLGNWISPERDIIVRCYKKGDIYYGKVVWFKEYFDDVPDNPHGVSESKWINAIVLRDLRFSHDEWNHGTIFHLKTGKSYSSYVKMPKENVLEVTGFIFFRFLCEHIVFERFTNPQLPPKSVQPVEKLRN